MNKFRFISFIGIFSFIYNFSNAQAPSFQLNSSEIYTNPVTIGSYETVSMSVKNIGTTGTFDFECDLETTSNGFISVIGKNCGVNVNANGTANLSFTDLSTDASPINPSGGAGSYRINLIVSSINGTTCPACGTKAVACISDVSAGSYTNPVPLTVDAACTGWATTPSGVTVLGTGGSGSFAVNTTIGGCSYSVVSQNTPWLTVTSNSGGTVNYSVASNSGSSRIGYIWIYDANSVHQATFAVNQNAGTPTYVTSSFTYTVNCSGQTSYFYDNSFGNPGPDSWSWSFGDGYTSTAQNPSHLYSSSGYFNVSLTVQNSAGNISTASGQIYIPSPAVSASFSYSAAYAGQTTTFTDNSNYGCGVANSGTWNFGDGYTSTSQNPSHIYSSAGTYNVQLTACNNLGYCNSYSQSITINPPSFPLSNFSANTTLLTAGQSTIYSNSSVNANNYEWNFNGGSPSTVNTTSASSFPVTYSAPGTYATTLTAINVAGSSINSKHGYINVMPSASITAVPNPLYTIRQGNNDPHAADPIDLATGTYGYHHDDLSMQVINSTAFVTRYYNTAKIGYDNGSGYGWNHNWDFRVMNEGDTIWRVFYPDGHAAPYIVLSSDTLNTFPLYEGMRDSLSKDVSGNYILKTLHGITYTFTQYDANKDGHLSTIVDRNGNATSLSYSGNLLGTVTLPGSRIFSFTYDGTNHLSSVTDPLGRMVGYTYDIDSNLTSVLDADSGVTFFQYNAQHQMTQILLPQGNQLLSNTYQNGRVVSQTDGVTNTSTISYDTLARVTTLNYPNGASATYYYDSLYRQIQKTDESGYSTYQSYDSLENIIMTTDKQGNTTTYTYDTRCNLLGVNQPLSVSYAFSYTSLNDKSTMTDPLGNVTQYIRDGNGNLTGINYPNSTAVTLGVNSNGQLTSYTNGNNHTTSFAYNSFGDLITKARPIGSYQYTHDAVGRIITVADPLAHTTTVSYNGKSQITTITDANSQIINNTYDHNGNLVSKVNKKNFTTIFTYDGNDRLTTKVDANGGVTSRYYDTRNNLVTLTDANNHSTQYSYTPRNERQSVTNPLTGVITFAYDANGNLTNSTDQVSGNSITYAYDALNRNISATNTLGQSVSQTYDADSRVVTSTDALTMPKTYLYDQVGLLKQTTNELGISANYIYDGNWNRISLTDLNGHTRSVSFDNDERPISLTDASGNSENLTYDNADNVISRNKANGIHITCTYDNINRPTVESFSSGENYSFIYDPDNNITDANCPSGTEHFQFDSLDRVTQFTDAYANIVKYSYDAVSNRNTLTYPGNHVVSYIYNGLNEMTDVNIWTGQHFSYTYDYSGKPLTVNYPNGLVSNYGYDQANRLTLKSTSQGPNVLFSNQLSLNANGDRIADNPTGIIPKVIQSDSRAYTYLANDFLTSDSVYTYSNDLSGNRTSQISVTDTFSYTFTADNLLKSIHHGSVSTFFEYDAYGNRIKRTQGGYEKRYVLDPAASLSQVIAETNASGTITAYDIFGRGLLQRIDSTGKNIYYHFDARGNTTALSNDSAHLTDTFTYDPFGYVLQHIGTTVQPFTFLGQHGILAENDSLYYMRARYYDAAAMRFMSADPYPVDVSDPYALNRYIYVYDNPFNYIDPSGMYGGRDDVPTNYCPSGTYNQYVNNTTNDEVSPVGYDVPISLTDFGLGVVDEVGQASELLKDAGIGTSILSTGISGYEVFSEYENGGARNINPWNLADFGVGVVGLGTEALVAAGIVSNPVGWVIGGAVLIYSGVSIADDIYTNW